jgi:polysaccharide export outer membrane protein
MMAFRLSRKTLALLLAAGCTLPAVSARAEYLISPGDVIELSATGIADLKQRARVDVRGEISLPLVGQVKAAGRPISELRAEVREILPTKSLRRKTPQGIEVLVVDPEEIALEIVEYRPVYVNGDVAKPGEQPYRVGMTVRQAVTVSGGYDLLRFRSDENPIMKSADLRSEYQNLWAEFAQAQAAIWRVQAELDGKASLPNSGVEELRQLPIAPSVVSQILRFESEKLTTNNAAFQRDRMSLTRRIKYSDEQSTLVAEQLEKTRQGVQLAMAELARTQSLHEKGMTPITRVTEERRLSLLTQTQNLQATERLEQVRKDREDLVRQLERLEDLRAAGLSRELLDSNMKLAVNKTKLEAVDEKLTVSSLLKSQLTRGKGASPDLIVVRKSSSGYERIVAEEDTEMLPGDTVEVSLRSRPEIAAGR